jgi:hypothetical protein
MHGLAHVLGLDSASGYWYLFWSGFGGDVAIIGALLASPVVYWRHHECHEARCLRLGHPFEGVVKCRRHRG